VHRRIRVDAETQHRAGHEILNAATGDLTYSGALFSLKVVGWQSSAKGSPGFAARGIDGKSVLEGIRIETAGIANLSTNPDPVEHARENAIFHAMKFPLPVGNWRSTMGSNHHHGPNLYALDFNLPENTDAGKPVSLVYDGTISFVDLETGGVIVNHRLPDGTMWETVYWHMTHILEGVTNLSYKGGKEAKAAGLNSETEMVNRSKVQSYIQGLINEKSPLLNLKQGTTLGLVGTEGDSTDFHLYFVVRRNGKAVNNFGWVNEMQNGFAFSAPITVDKKLSFQWNYDLHALVNDNERIVIQRDNIVVQEWSDEEKKMVAIERPINVAYAWEAGKSIDQMERVVWDAKRGVWVKASEADIPMKRWDPTLQSFVSL
jgi:hypothetical protein